MQSNNYLSRQFIVGAASCSRFRGAASNLTAEKTTDGCADSGSNRGPNGSATRSAG